MSIDMPVATDNKLNPQRKQARQTLLVFLLGLLELETEPAKSLDRLLPLDLYRDILPATLRATANPPPGGFVATRIKADFARSAGHT